MKSMAKKRTPPNPPEPPEEGPKKRYPSRDRIRYVAVPVHLYELLEKYASDHSDQDTQRSVSWAARRVVRIGLEQEGYDTEPQPSPPDPSED